MKTRTLLAALAAVLLTLVTAAPAQALAPITYVADCPTNQYGEQAAFQQFVTRNWNGQAISVTAQPLPNGNIKPLGSSVNNTNGGITYWTVQDFDTVKYVITTPGDANFFYHVSCYY